MDNEKMIKRLESMYLTLGFCIGCALFMMVAIIIYWGAIL